VVSSVRRAANRALRAKRRVSGIRPSWPGLRGRLRWAAAARNPGLAGQLAVLAAWMGAFVGGSYLPDIPHGRVHLGRRDVERHPAVQSGVGDLLAALNGRVLDTCTITQRDLSQRYARR
jgi:hypothetical protein